ncbi:Retrovirus-related Pol polyprotein from transposon 412 [Frankliniella fusca]|uniref:RNA-directed DNA polymerase n=1 Tax=Frankliniella fusca TaxID=407009 RepID=A0AAE1H884_9NEOP|nr:Retrovirus-related Pol polyprotein from transposon 412 [Frankliniella fusca]
MEVKFAWRTELLKEAGERAEGADVLRFQPGPPTPRPRLSLKRDSTNAAGEEGSGQQDADAVRRTQPETGSPAAAGQQERGAGHQHDGVHAQPAKQSRPEVGQSDAQERSQSSGAEPVRVAPFPSQRSESSQGARAEPPPAPPEPTSSEEGDDDLREDSEEEPASSETGSFTTALSGSELQSERPQGDVRLCLPRKIKLAPGAKVTVAAGDQLLPYQSLSQYTPVLGERGVQVSFVEDHTGMNGQAALQLENFGEETTDILKVAALQVEKDGEYEPVYDEGRFKEEQRRDVTYGPIIAGLEDGQEHANFFLADGLLHRRVGSDGLHAVVVPPTMTDKLVRDFHCPPWAAHASRDRTLSKLRERFWWPGMYTQVLRFTRGCHSCALYKRGTHARPAPLQLPVVPRQPFEAMATDLYGPLPVSSYSGARYVLLAICLHTRWVEAIPLRDQMAPTVARAIVQEIVCRYGCPEYLVSDNGACYSAKLYTEMCRILQVRAIKTTPLHAMSNGVVERANQVMGQALCHYVNEKKHDWEEFLQLVMCSVRSSVSRSTGETPYFSVFHRDMSLPTAALLTPRRVTYADTPALTEKLLQDMSLSTELLRQENIKAKQEGKQYYDRRAGEDVKFYVGQRVYLAVKVKKKGLGRKWRRRYSGPWRIVERLSPTTFKIRTIFEQKPQVYTVHCNRLKHAYEYDNLLTAERRRRRTQDLAEDTDGPDLEALSTSSGSESDVTEPETESRTRRRPAARRGTPGAVVASRGASPAAQQGHTDGDEWTDVEGDPGRGEESSREVTTPAAHATPSTLEHGGLPTPARQGATPAPRRASAGQPHRAPRRAALPARGAPGGPQQLLRRSQAAGGRHHDRSELPSPGCLTCSEGDRGPTGYERGSAVTADTSLVGYDCTAPGANVSVVELEEVEDCPSPEEYGKPEPRVIQLVQARKYNTIKVHACLFEVTKRVKYCGMHHHTSEVWHGTRTGVKYLGRDTCRKIHATGFYHHAGTTLGPIGQSDVKRAHVPVVGSYSVGGHCETGNWASPEGVTYKQVVVTDDVTLVTQVFEAKVEVEERNQVVLPSGQRCAMAAGYCDDVTHGDAFWEPLQESGCFSNDYDVLYQGAADLITIPKINAQYIVVHDQRHLFAIRMERSQPLCGHAAWITEHRRLIVVEQGPVGGFPFKSDNESQMLPANADLLTYINTKSMFQEIMVKKRLEALQNDAVFERCKLEREGVHSRLAMAQASADPVARLLQNERGFNGVVMGNVLYMVACVPRRVALRNVSRCYQEIPVMVDDQPAFVTPHSRLIVNVGQEVTCNPATPPMHRIGNEWIKFTPAAERAAPPARLRMSLQRGVALPLFQGVGTAGVYPREVVEGLQESLQMSAERNALLTTISRKAVGKDADATAFQLANIFTGQDLEGIAMGYFDRVWASLGTFGSYSSVFMALYILIVLVKTVAEAVMYGRLLRGIASCWVVTLASLWSGLASALVIRHERHVRERGLPDIDVERGEPPSSTPSRRSVTFNVGDTQPRSSDAEHLPLEQLPRRPEPLCVNRSTSRNPFNDPGRTRADPRGAQWTSPDTC